MDKRVNYGSVQAVLRAKVVNVQKSFILKVVTVGNSIASELW